MQIIGGVLEKENLVGLVPTVSRGRGLEDLTMICLLEYLVVCWLLVDSVGFAVVGYLCEYSII